MVTRNARRRGRGGRRARDARVEQDVSWDVELASGAKILVSSMVRNCPIQFGDITTCADLRITPLGSYDVVLGMDWLCAHNTEMDYRQKKVGCFDDYGTPMVILGV